MKKGLLILILCGGAVACSSDKQESVAVNQQTKKDVLLDASARLSHLAVVLFLNPDPTVL